MKKIISNILIINVIFMMSAQEAIKNPPYFAKIKDDPEVKEMAKYAEKLAEFYTLGEEIARINTASGVEESNAALIQKFKNAGITISLADISISAASYRLLKKLSLPNDEELKKEADKVLKTRYVLPFFKSTGKVLASSYVAGQNKRISTDTKNIVDKYKKLGFYKPKFPCAVLATAIWAAELRNANKTADTVDSFFKAVCNANGAIDQ
jgi:hypothetical protein